MPLNISGSLVSPDTAETLEHNSIIQRGLAVHLDLDSQDFYPGNDTVYDQSGNNKNGTMYNGTGVAFDGSNDYIDIGAIDVPPRSQGTITAWFKPDSVSSPVVGTILDSNGGWFTLQRVASSINFVAGYSGSAPYSYNAGSISTAKYWFVCGTYDGDIRVWIDGKQVGNTYTVPQGDIQGNLFKIASTGGTGAGKISDVRVYNKSLDINQISELYNNPQTVIPVGLEASDLVGWWPMSEGSGTIAYDASGYDNHGTLTNGPTWHQGNPDIPQLGGKGQSQKMYHGGGGTGDYVNIGDALNFGTGDFTMACWFKTDSSTNEKPMLTKGYYTAGYNGNFQFRVNEWNQGRLRFSGGDGQSTGIDIYTGSTAVFSTNTWNHAAVTRKSGAWIMYMNGSPVTIASGTPTYSGNIGNNAASGSIGGEPYYQVSTVNGYFGGLIDEVAAWDRALSLEDIQKLAATRVNPGSNPNPSDARTIEGPSLKGYWRNDGPSRWIDLSGQENDGIVQGSPARLNFPEGRIKERDSQGFPSNISHFSFDGSDTYISLPSLDVTGSKTISMWFYTNVKGTGFLFQGGDGTDQFSIMLGATNGASTTGVVRAQANDASSGYNDYAKDTTAGGIDTGKWYNVTATKKTGYVLNMYLNGVNDTNPGANWSYTPDVSYIIGKRNESSGNWVDGKIGSFMMYDRILSTKEILHNFNLQRDRFGV